MVNWSLETKIDLLRTIYNVKRSNIYSDIAGHLPLLYKLAQTIKPRVIIHSGVRDGNSCSAFALAQLENGGKLIDIDVLKNSDGDLRKIRDNTENWEMNINNVQDKDLLIKLQDYKGLVDIWFSDTCHSYNGTKFELEEYTKLLSSKGIILIHDMDPWNSYEGQTKAIEQWMEKNSEWKVKIQKGHNGMAVFYRNEKHLCGVKCDSNVGDEYPWGNDLKLIKKELLKSKESGLSSLLEVNKEDFENMIKN